MDTEFWEKEQPKFVSPHPNINTDPFPAVPAELKEKRQWVIWKFETREGKTTKIPYQTNGQKAKSNDPSTWTDYENAYREYNRQKSKYAGIGFVFCDTDDYTGIDLDDCLDENQKIKPWATEIVDRLKIVSYGEVSPSGNGIKFWTRAKLPTDTKHKGYVTSDGDVCSEREGDGAIEAYDNGRYFTVTGQGKYAIKDGQEVINWIYEKYLKPQPKTTDNRRNQQTTPPNLSVDEVITKIRKSKQVHKFEALMKGDTTGYGSSSEADMALCSVIAFWTQNSEIIDAIFRQSKLMRNKWDEKHRSDGATYGEMTIESACNNLQQTYQPQKKKTPRKTYEGFYQRRAKRRRYR